MGARDRRSWRIAGRAVLGAAAPHADPRAETPVPRRRRDRRGAESRRESRPGRQGARARGGDRRLLQVRAFGTQAFTGILRGLALFRGAHHRILRHQSFAGATGRRLHRRIQHRHTDALRRRAVLVGVHSVLQQLPVRSGPEARRGPRRPLGRGCGQPDLEPADPLYRCRCHADWRPVVAVVAAEVLALRHQDRHQPARLRRRGRSPHRARPADGSNPDRHRAVRNPAVRFVLRRRRQSRHRAYHGGDHGDRRLRVLLGERLHGGSGRLIQQPGFRHHDLDHPVRLVDPARHHGQGLDGRAGCRNHDRRSDL